MSKIPNYNESRADDVVQNALDGLSRLLLWGGLLATVSGIGFLIYTYVMFTGGAQASEAQALSNINIFSKILIAGTLGLGVSTALMFWGEETLAILQLGFAAALYFAPLYLPNFLGGPSNPPPAQAAMAALQMGGQIFGALAILVLIGDITVRIRTRTQQGSRADQLKYGKGVKEERDIRNIFMGKCWQLPFCRKFVRERCPIYHARRTCWKERVGCMCEEEVIRNAMENKPIPKDMVLSTKYIPYNNKLTEGQKAERCRQCVIYNEHQKHKYKLALPLTIAIFALVYVLFRTPLLEATGSMIRNFDRVVGNLTLRKDGPGLTMKTGVFEELLLACFMIVLFAYVMKILEFLVFKLKV
jgi:hypothetical protein